jgi:hypothetical protein
MAARALLAISNFEKFVFYALFQFVHEEHRPNCFALLAAYTVTGNKNTAIEVLPELKALGWGVGTSKRACLAETSRPGCCRACPRIRPKGGSAGDACATGSYCPASPPYAVITGRCDMRAIFEGNYRVDQLVGLVADLVQHLEKNGVQHLGSVNMYFTPIQHGHKMSFFDEVGSDVDILRFEPLAISEFVPNHAGVQLESKLDSVSLAAKSEMYFFSRYEDQTKDKA